MRHRLAQVVDAHAPTPPTTAEARAERGAPALVAPPSWDALRAYVSLLRGVIDGLPFAVAVLDGAGALTIWNAELSALLDAPLRAGESDLSALIRELGRIVSDADALGSGLRERVGSPDEGEEFEIALRDGGALAISVGELDRASGARLICLRDTTRELHTRRELEHRAMHDPLTGLPNRELLMDRLERRARPPRPSGTASAVLFIDLDGFKAVNDEHGHEVGNELLVSVAARLRREVRDGDTVARYGGDEFVVLCEDLVHIDAAQPLARRLADAIGQPVSAGDRLLAVQASIGVVVEQNPGVSAEALLTRADAEMYRVKQRGR